MSHKAEHHQQHRQERAEEKAEEKRFDDLQEQRPGMPFPLWFWVFGFILTFAAVLIWTLLL
ncbi:MAG TPA: hypothetical protein VGM05_15535 [Planctomycetaceae bacterium]|jgi:hypothetical protein